MRVALQRWRLLLLPPPRLLHASVVTAGCCYCRRHNSYKTMAWTVAVPVLTVLTLVRTSQPHDIFGGLLPRHRSVADHQVPHDDLSSMPDLQFTRVQPNPYSEARPALEPDPYLQQFYPSSPAIFPDLSRHQIKPYPDPLTVIPNPNLPQIQPEPYSTYPQLVNPALTTVVLPSYPEVAAIPGCPLPVHSYQPEVCPTYNMENIHVPPHQCSIISQTNPILFRDQILRIIYEGSHFQGSVQCRASVSELLVRLTLIEDKLRGLVKSETKLKVHADILAQIQLRIGEKRPGNIGSVGAQGNKGLRGTRGSRGSAGRCITIGTPIDMTGRPGPTGPKGVTGPPGDKICDCDGLPGELGFRGYNIPGSPGPKGFKGQKGNRGFNYNPMSDTV